MQPTEPDPREPGIPEATINRNWTKLIQQLRSTQTGVQVLTWFLLTPPAVSGDDRQQVARAGLVLVALTTCGVVFLAFDLVIGRTGGVVAELVALVARRLPRAVGGPPAPCLTMTGHCIVRVAAC